jgi:hypothetical protein
VDELVFLQDLIFFISPNVVSAGIPLSTIYEAYLPKLSSLSKVNVKIADENSTFFVSPVKELVIKIIHFLITAKA